MTKSPRSKNIGPGLVLFISFGLLTCNEKVRFLCDGLFGGMQEAHLWSSRQSYCTLSCLDIGLHRYCNTGVWFLAKQVVSMPHRRDVLDTLKSNPLLIKKNKYLVYSISSNDEKYEIMKSNWIQFHWRSWQQGNIVKTYNEYRFHRVIHK